MDQKKSQHFPCIIVHGGAWSIPNPFLEKYYAGIQQAAKAGYGILKNVSIQFCDNITCLFRPTSPFNIAVVIQRKTAKS